MRVTPGSRRSKHPGRLRPTITRSTVDGPRRPGPALRHAHRRGGAGNGRGGGGTGHRACHPAGAGIGRRDRRGSGADPRGGARGQVAAAPGAVAGVPIFVTDPQTAELAKGAANTFLGLKISYINAVADMCEAAGGDVSQIVEILGIDPGIGSGGMRPGIGYGGGCLPKDVRAFTASARQLGAGQAAALLRAAEKINESRTDVALDLITRALGDRPIKGARVTVWGAA
ncbi:hypothetical protein ABZ876_36845 [Streptomyces sp. NPDC046931]|uniref:hypothetical protein n=1 Tax=Streptomyces sp. NPDC046931 TaxID=3154806 RepID=UPI0033C8223F